MMVWMTEPVKNIVENFDTYDPGEFNHDGTKLEKRGFVNIGNYDLYLGEWAVFKNI